jgi:hypothetical protein
VARGQQKANAERSFIALIFGFYSSVLKAIEPTDGKLPLGKQKTRVCERKRGADQPK